jgi:hypothetical protein
MSLQDLIINRDTYALNDTSKQSLQRHIQKLVKSALQEDQIRFLTTISNEAKARRSTKSLVLGKAKVMSYEDLEQARTKRAVKEAAKEAKGKGKRGRKCKSAASEADDAEAGDAEVDEAEADEATADKAKRSRKRKSAALEADAPEPKAKVSRIREAPEPARALVAQMSGTQVAEDEIAPEPLRAPVARMW